MNETTRANTRSLASELLKIRTPWRPESECKDRQGFPVVDGPLVIAAGRAWYAQIATIHRIPQAAVTPPTIRQLRDWIPQHIGTIEIEMADDAEKRRQRVSMDAAALERTSAAESPETRPNGQDPDALEMWETLLAETCGGMAPQTFQRWLAGTSGMAVRESGLIVSVPTPAARDWISSRLLSAITKAAPVPVHLIVEGDPLPD